MSFLDDDDLTIAKYYPLGLASYEKTSQVFFFFWSNNEVYRDLGDGVGKYEKKILNLEGSSSQGSGWCVFGDEW